MVAVPVRRLHPDAQLPAYATDGAAGADLHARLDQPLVLPPRGRALVPTGLAMALPKGYELQVRPRSGLALKHGITVLNTPGTIDSDYRGEIGVILLNTSQEPFRVVPGERIAQGVVARHETAVFSDSDRLPPTARGAGSFGSTGTGAVPAETPSPVQAPAERTAGPAAPMDGLSRVVIACAALLAVGIGGAGIDVLPPWAGAAAAAGSALFLCGLLLLPGKRTHQPAG